jgi:hypothetical protein
LFVWQKARFIELSASAVTAQMLAGVKASGGKLSAL